MQAIIVVLVLLGLIVFLTLFTNQRRSFGSESGSSGRSGTG